VAGYNIPIFQLQRAQTSNTGSLTPCFQAGIYIDNTCIVPPSLAFKPIHTRDAQKNFVI
jgi:hypothetical protein